VATFARCKKYKENNINKEKEVRKEKKRKAKQNSQTKIEISRC
jgi:hypothetical protein